MLLAASLNIRFSPVGLPGLFLAWAIVFSTAASADEVADRRIQISLPIFPRIVAVDNHFHEKLLTDGKVSLVFIYDSNKDKAEQLSKVLAQQLTNVAGLDFSSTAVSVHDQLQDRAPVPTALFVAETLPEKTFGLLLDYSVEEHRILFSPFAGDVERGATAGITITSRVKPFFNISTLKRADIEINSVLMKLSKRYE